MVEMKVEGLTLDPLTNMPIIILKDLTGAKALPIWVGIFEANAIALEIESISTPRPMTHDLLKNLIHTFKAEIKHILVNELKDNTFYAVISLVINGDTLNSLYILYGNEPHILYFREHEKNTSPMEWI